MSNYSNVYNEDTLGLFRNRNAGTGTEEYDRKTDLDLSNLYLTSRNHQLLELLYAKSWACERVIDFYPLAMGQAWGTLNLKGDEGAEVNEDCSKILKRLQHAYTYGQILGNLYGEGYVIRLVDDGRELSEPIDYEAVTKIEYSRVFDYREVQPKIDNFYGDYYQPELYWFYPTSHGGMQDLNTNNIIHSERLIRFSGRFLPPKLFEQNNYCHASLLEVFLMPLRRYDDPLSHVSSALTSFEFLLWGVDNLFDIIENGTPEEVSALKKRYADIQRDLSSLRGGTYDKRKEQLDIAKREFNNVAPNLEQLKNEMIAASGLTKTQLYNEHPAGMNSTGESELRQQAKEVTKLQVKQWGPIIEDDIKLILKATKHTEPYEWEWNDSYQETQEEQEDRKDKIADRDKKYVEMGVLLPSEVRQRFVGPVYNEQITVEDEEIEMSETPAPKPEKEEVSNEDLPEEQQENMDAMTFVGESKSQKFVPEGQVISNFEYASIELEDLQNLVDE